MSRQYLNLSNVTGSGESRPLLLAISNVISVSPNIDFGANSLIICVAGFEFYVQETVQEIAKQLGHLDENKIRNEQDESQIRNEQNEEWLNAIAKEHIALTGKPWTTLDDIKSNISAFVDIILERAKVSQGKKD